MSLCKISIIVFAVIIISGCSVNAFDTPVMSAPVSVPEPPLASAPSYSDFNVVSSANTMNSLNISGSLYVDINNVGQEPENFGVYTYVLIRQGASNSALRKKAALVAAIHDLSFGNFNSYVPSGAPESNYNLFVIPADNLSNFSTQFLDILARKERRFYGEGPFLLTFNDKITNIAANNGQYMFIDFSKLNTHSIRYVVNEYKKHEFKTGIYPGAKTNRFKVYLLSTVFHLKDSIESGLVMRDALSKLFY